MTEHFPTYAIQTAVLCGSIQLQKTANTGDTAKTVKEPQGPQSKRKPSATFRKTTAAFRR